MSGKSSAEKQNELELVNVNEESVKQVVRRVMEELGACQCKICYANACAIVLNELEPKYATSKKGELLSQISNSTISSRVRLTAEATKAIMKVIKNPLH